MAGLGLEEREERVVEEVLLSLWALLLLLLLWLPSGLCLVFWSHRDSLEAAWASVAGSPSSHGAAAPLGSFSEGLGWASP